VGARATRGGPGAIRPLRRLAVCGLAILTCAFAPGPLAPAGPVGAAERIILLDSLAIMLAIIVPVIVAILAFAWWFRASNTRAVHLPDWSYSGRLEFIVWSIPAMVVLFLGGIGWISSHDLDPARPLNSGPPAVEVQVVALDWKWLFIYPDQGVASVDALVLPAGAPVRFRLTSASVMNSFFVPALGSQIYAMAGMTTSLNLKAERPGVYPGLSAQFSGDGFSDMRFDTLAVTPDQFTAWVAAVKARRAALDQGAYASLARPSSNLAPFTYGAVTPGLFGWIVATTAPGNSPAEARVVAAASAQGAP
jgi:cytochrome o ubiquinol oxidase subunit 2